MKRLIFLCMAMLALVGCNQATTLDSSQGEKAFYILSMDENSKAMSLDEIEMLSTDDTDRIAKLGLDVNNDFPDGFYIYNEKEEKEVFTVADDAKFTYLDWENNYKEVEANYYSFLEQYENKKKLYDDAITRIPHKITIKGGKVTDVTEIYIP